MASKEQTGDGGGFASAISTFLAEIAYFVIMIIVIFLPISLIGAFKIFAAFMLVGLVLEWILAVLMQLEQTRFAEESDDLAEMADEKSGVSGMTVGKTKKAPTEQFPLGF